jgi:hypothetical protein
MLDDDAVAAALPLPAACSLSLPGCLPGLQVDYLLVQYIMQATNIRLKWASPRAVSWSFLASDLLCLIIQSVGAAIVFGGDGRPGTAPGQALGRGLLILGLALQLAFFALFTLVTVRVFRIYSAAVAVKTAGQSQPGAQCVAVREAGTIEAALWCLFGTIALLSVRNIYRFAEFVEGFDGWLAGNEPCFYVFDSVMILGIIIVFTVWHPGKLLMRAMDKVHTTRDGDVIEGA